MLRELPALPVRALALELSRQAEPRFVTLHLKSGRDLQGQLLRCDEGMDASLTLALAGTVDVSYLALGSVEAITVHGAAHIAHVLSRGQLDEEGDEPVTVLGLKRRCAEIQAQLRERVGGALEFDCAWSTLPENERAQRSLARWVEDLFSALLTVAEDSLGSSAIRSLMRVHTAHGESSKVILESGVVRCVVNLDGGPSGRPRLPDALEAVL